MAEKKKKAPIMPYKDRTGATQPKSAKKPAAKQPSKSVAKQPSKPAIIKVANALEDAVGRIGNKVKSITGSARDTIVTQIDTAIKNRKADLAKEVDLAKKRNLVEDGKRDKAYDRGDYDSGAFRSEQSIKAYVLSHSSQRELDQLQQAESKWNKFKGSIGYRGNPKAKKK